MHARSLVSASDKKITVGLLGTSRYRVFLQHHSLVTSEHYFVLESSLAVCTTVPLAADFATYFSQLFSKALRANRKIS